MKKNVNEHFINLLKTMKSRIEESISDVDVKFDNLTKIMRKMYIVFSDKAFIKLFLRTWRNMWSAYQTKNRRKVCETLMKNITSKKMKLHKNLIKSNFFFAIHMKTKRIKLINYFFFRRVFIVLTSDCFYEHSRQTLKHILFFWSKRRQRMLRDDETTNMSEFLNISKNLKVSIIWLMKINLLTQFSLIKKDND
jgi:hypothetical protein